LLSRALAGAAATALEEVHDHRSDDVVGDANGCGQAAERSGVVVAPSATRLRDHGQPTLRITNPKEELNDA
jgi:hypothetical protein